MDITNQLPDDSKSREQLVREVKDLRSKLEAEREYRRHLSGENKQRTEEQSFSPIGNTIECEQVEEEFKASEELIFSKAFHFCHTFLFISDLSTGKFIEVNNAYCTLTGWTRDELIGHTSLERNILTLAGRAEIVNILRSTGRVQMMETEVIAKTGRIIPCQFSAEIIMLQNRKCIVCSGTDLTEQKKNEEALRESEERFRALVTASSDVLYLMNPDWNEMRQLQSQNILTDTDAPNPDWLHEYIPLEEHSRVSAAINEAIRDQSVFELEYRVIQEDGSIGWTFSRAIPLLDDKGEIYEWFGAASDITDRKRNKEALRESQERMQFTLEATNIGIWDLDLEDKTAYHSPEHDRIFGYEEPVEDWTQEDFLHHVLPEHRELLVRMVEDASASGAEWTYDCPIRRADGEIRWIWFTGQRRIDKRGRARVFGVVMDITERKRAEEELQQKTAQLEATIDSTPGGYIVYGLDRSIVRQNAVAKEVLGFTGKEQTLSDEKRFGKLQVQLPNGEPFPLEHIPSNRAFEGEIVRNVIMKVVRPHRHYWLSVGAAPITSPNGTMLGVVMEFSDITEHKHAEEKLRESEEKFRSVFEQAAIGIGRVSFHDTLWIEVNNTFSGMVGYTQEELQRTPWPHITHPDDIDLDLIPFRKMAAGELESYTVEKRFIHKKGHHVWARLTLSLVRDSRGLPDYEIAIIENITQRKETEEALKISEEKFSKAFYVSPTFLFISELSTGTFIEVNDACCLLSGWSRDELIGHTSLKRNIFSAASNEKIVMGLQSAGRVEMMEIDILTKTGGVKTCLFSAEIMKYIGKECIVCSGVDLTERKKTEEKLEAVNKELEAFSYSVSHDLRTPLLAMCRLSSLLRTHTGQLDSKVNEYLQRIETVAQKMNLLIDDILRLSKISKQEMAKEEIDLSGMVRGVVNELEQQHPQRYVWTSIADDLKTRGDAQLIKIALTNLLSNAWKYTGRTIEAHVEFGMCKKNGKEVFFIRDNGVGFPMEQAERLFEPFQRLHSASEFSGSGIGLPLVYRVINRHGGEIWGEGASGEGAIFYFTFGP